MKHIITDDHDLGNGWTLYTEYKPVDEDAGVWGWYWAVEQDGEDLEEPIEERRFLSEPSRLLGNTNTALLREVIGPFSTEVAAKKAGISICTQIKGDSAQWEHLTNGEFGCAR